MPELRLVVHRATDQIGGNCIELVTSGSRILLDVGRPLDAPRNATGLLPKTLDISGPLSGVLISHPHQDHFGLLGELPADTPVFSGRATEKLLRITAEISGLIVNQEFQHWRPGTPFNIGLFRVTPYLTDHSAFDAHMLLIEAAGKRVLYTGDFRVHGRKASLVRQLVESGLGSVDALLIEGTNLGSDKPCVTEAELEERYVALFARTKGQVFVAWSAQNIDRTVTLYRACLQSGRTLVVDLYTADVLCALADEGKIPQPSWPQLKVVITRAFARLYRAKGRADFVDRMAKHAMSASRLRNGAFTIMTRLSLAEDYETAGIQPGPSDAWSWAQWHGYLRNEDGSRLAAWFESGGTPAHHIHTSGHASAADLRWFAEQLRPKALIPIHGAEWDTHLHAFANVARIFDGEPFLID